MKGVSFDWLNTLFLVTVELKSSLGLFLREPGRMNIKGYI